MDSQIVHILYLMVSQAGVLNGGPAGRQVRQAAGRADRLAGGQASQAYSRVGRQTGRQTRHTVR